MRLVQHLFFNNKYRFLFYLLPFLLIYYFTYFFYSMNDTLAYDNIKQIHTIKKDKEINLLDFAVNLEKKIKAKNLTIKNIKITSNKILVQIEDEFLNTLKIIDYTEKYSSNLEIKRLSFKSINDNKIDLNFEVELNKRNISYKKQLAKNIEKGILYQKNKLALKTSKEVNKRIEIDAIVGKSVLINQKWYKIGDVISNKKLTLIKTDFIILEKNGHKNKIWIYNNEYTR